MQCNYMFYLITVISFLSLNDKNSHQNEKQNEHQPEFILAKYILKRKSQKL